MDDSSSSSQSPEIAAVPISCSPPIIASVNGRIRPLLDCVDELHHPLLSKIDKSMVGVPVLAQKLVSIQADIISKSLPEIERKINDKLATNMAELNRLPQHLSSVAEALTAFMHILSSFKKSIKKILVRGEFDEYPEEKEMHCTAKLVEMVDQYSNELHSKNFDKKEDFLMEEIKALEETNGIGLPNFLPRHLFLSAMQKRVKEVALIPEDFVDRVWNLVPHLNYFELKQ